ncbi:MAG TPA: DUF5074 domain-containing protein, partial [Luteibaculaceae bacterium]|nr:DUF5074 domain-containing protein [Luteibaculaceae bacterium]
VYALANQEEMGDILQSLYLMGDTLFAVINNSQKIIALNARTFAKIGVINTGGFPQSFCPTGDGFALVTDLFGGPVKVVNLSTFAVVSNFSCPGSTGDMLPIGDGIYMTNSSSEYLYKVSKASKTIVDSVLVGKGANGLALDKNGKVWISLGIVYDENFMPIENGKIKRLNVSSKAIEFNQTLVAGGARKLKINASNDVLYYLNNGVQKMEITSTSLPTIPFYSAAGASFNALGIDPVNQYILVGDAKNYTSEGTVTVLRQDGSVQSSYTAGVAPSDFAFIKQ